MAYSQRTIYSYKHQQTHTFRKNFAQKRWIVEEKVALLIMLKKFQNVVKKNLKKKSKVKDNVSFFQYITKVKGVQDIKKSICLIRSF